MITKSVEKYSGLPFRKGTARFVVFSNLFFIYVFLPANLVLYFAVKNLRLRNIIMVLFSLTFYAWGEPVCVGLLLFTALVNWGLGFAVAEHRQAAPEKAKGALVLAVVVDLALLMLFKYSGFLVDNLNALLGAEIPNPGLTLPIGISFYTFQIISYMADVYRGQVQCQRSFLKFLMYVTMYHQLVAGPIVRYEWIAKEIDDRPVIPAEIWNGVCRFCVGLTKKVVMANGAGALASRYLDEDFSKVSSLGALFGILMFALQIYYDFSAYSDMAIGMGRIFGFHYLENFNYPYISTSITDFWRRWHISLSTFFRDYVYIPLGGKYCHQIRNILIVWLLTGLWHGASWNFVFWGGFYGLFLILEKRFLLRRLEKCPKAVGWLYSTVIVLIGWALFYFTDTARLFAFFGALFGGGVSDPALWITIQNNLFWIILSVVFCAPVLPKIKSLAAARCPNGDTSVLVPVQAVCCCGMLLICTALLVGQSYNPFLYYRF